MIHDILLLSSGSPFMVNALIGNLTNEGYNVVTAEAQPRTMGRYRGKFNAAILFLGDALLVHRDVLSAFGSLCAEEETPLFAVGTAEELEIAAKSIPEEALAARFEKPLNIRQLISALDSLNRGGDIASAPPKHLLLVDDDPDYLKLVSRWLSGNYRVSVVTSGMQAIAFLGKQHPDLILLDYNMPVASGPQVLEMIRGERETADIPVIFLTGKDDSESVNRVLAFKPNGYILKSVSRDSLLARLKEFFESL